MSIYMGIDPGKKGGIAFICEDGAYQTMEYSDDALKDLANVYADDLKVVVEHVTAMRGQGVTSMFTFGQGFGYILGVLEANNVRYELVRPQKWKKEFSLTKNKNKSIDVCKRLFPEVNLKRTPKCTKDHDGMAEALLIAEYARRHMK